MTLTAFSIANFKAFAATQRVPLRPITLMYGANSAGKSSVIHALALAHHAIETGDLDIQRTQIGGESIDLGGFRQYVHGRVEGRQVELGFELDPGHLSGHLAELLRAAREIVVELTIGEGITSDQQTLFGDPVREFDREGVIRVERFEMKVDGKSLLSMSVRAALRGALRELMGGLGTALEDEIRRLRYLGPLRSYPPRYLAFSQDHDPNWFAGGGYAWDVVRTREDIRRRVNAWLGDANRLKTPYELKVRDLLPATLVSRDLPAKLHKALHDIVASLLEGMDADKMIDLSLLARQVAERLHNRYILTDLGGVTFGIGLNEGDEGETDDITLMDRGQYELRWSQYSGNPPAGFEQEGDPIEVVGTRKLPTPS